MMSVSKTIKLSNNVEMPMLGLGTWQSAKEECYNAMHLIHIVLYELDAFPLESLSLSVI